MSLQDRLLREASVFVLLMLWAGIVAVRALYTAPPLPGKEDLWLLGILCAGAVAFGAGYVARGLKDDEH